MLTAPNTFLDALSATACFGFHEWTGPYETVVRPGSGGPRRYGPLLVARSTTLDGQTLHKDRIPIVRAERALISIAPRVGGRQLGRAFREAIRLKTTTANQIARALDGQRGTAALVALCDRYASIPYHRCRSDAEFRALIIEVDGAQFHPFTQDDADKQARWEAAGYTVERIPSDDVYYRPERLLALVNVPISRR